MHVDFLQFFLRNRTSRREIIKQNVDNCVRIKLVAMMTLEIYPTAFAQVGKSIPWNIVIFSFATPVNQSGTSDATLGHGVMQFKGIRTSDVWIIFKKISTSTLQAGSDDINKIKLVAELNFVIQWTLVCKD